MRIIMIIPFDPSTGGGVMRAVKSQETVYRMLGASVETIYASELDGVDLRNYDLIHVHGPLIIRGLVMIRRSRVPAILTVHGWVVDEALTAIRMNPLGNFHYIFRIMNWLLHRLILIDLIYSAVTTVSEITMARNHLRGVVIPNALITGAVDEAIAGCPNSDGGECLKAITYVSIGGSKVLSVPRLVKIVEEVNRASSGTMKLLIFGDVNGRDTENIKFMGYRDDFLCHLMSANIMILGYEMSELGYAILEAGYLRVPVAKFRGEYEELEDGVHGIIADDDEDMIKKLTEFAENPSLAREWGENLRAHILRTRSPDVIGEKWRHLIDEVTENRS